MSLNDNAVIYSRVIDGVKVENFYSYAYEKDGMFFGLGCDSTLEQISEKLKGWNYSEVNVWVESEVEFYKRKLNFGKAVETTKTAFDEAFNCLPPMRYAHSSYMTGFMMSEETAAGYYTFYIRLNERYFCIQEHFKTSYATIEASIKRQLLEAVCD